MTWHAVDLSVKAVFISITHAVIPLIRAAIEERGRSMSARQAAMVAWDVSLFESDQTSSSTPKMAKRYQVVVDQIPTSGGGFIEAFRVALVEFGCLGERHFDISGYPYESTAEALQEDWKALGVDARVAINKIASEAGCHVQKEQSPTSEQARTSATSTRK